MVPNTLVERLPIHINKMLNGTHRLLDIPLLLVISYSINESKGSRVALITSPRCCNHLDFPQIWEPLLVRQNLAQKSEPFDVPVDDMPPIYKDYNNLQDCQPLERSKVIAWSIPA